jgi:hypothetical protein
MMDAKSNKSEFSDFELVTLWWKLLTRRPYWYQSKAVGDLHKENKKWFADKYNGKVPATSKTK